MAAAAEVQVQEAAPKKVRGIQQLEQLVMTRLGKVQASVKGVEKELRERAEGLFKTIEEFQTTAVTRLNTFKGVVNLEVVGQRAERLLADGVRVTEAAVEKLGARVIELPVFAQLASTPTARQAFERVQARIGEMRARFETQGAPEKTDSAVETATSEKTVE